MSAGALTEPAIMNDFFILMLCLLQVPFGEVTAVTDWLEVRGEVNKPLNEHPKRPIDGFDCTRKEVSNFCVVITLLFIKYHPSSH